MKIIRFVLLFVSFFALSQVKQETMEVNGENWIRVLQKATYYIDSTNTLNFVSVTNKLNNFKNNTNNLITLKKQANNLWIRLKFKNVAEKQKYWLGIYTQADTIVVYEKLDNTKNFTFKKLSNYSKPSKQRGNFNVRFHYVPFELEKQQTLEVLLLVKNRRHFTNFYLDFTTPEDSLNWEKGFYWIISGFISVFFFISLLCLAFGIANKNWIFINYSFYLLLTVLFILHEELFISVFDTHFVYTFLYKTNSLFLMVIAMGLNLNLFLMLTNLKKVNFLFYKVIKLFSYFVIVFGLLTCIIYFFNPQLNFLNVFYSILWDLALFLNLFSVVLTTIIVFYYFYKNNKSIFGFFISIILLLLNPVIYYLNYVKIIPLYEIDHPNYYYYVILIEIFSLGVFIFFQYRNKIKDNIFLLKAKIESENKLKSEKEKINGIINNTIIETQQKLLSNLSKDLHDDLGQKLSVINFSIENLKLKYEGIEVDEIKKYLVEVSQSIRDLSHWLNNFEFESSSFFEIINLDANRINKILSVHVEVVEIEKIDISIQEKIILFRVYQELINNSLKYAKADKIEIEIFNNEFNFIDNGIGFNEFNSIDGIGFKNIKDRLSIIKWDFEKIENEKNGSNFKIYKI